VPDQFYIFGIPEGFFHPEGVKRQLTVFIRLFLFGKVSCGFVIVDLVFPIACIIQPVHSDVPLELPFRIEIDIFFGLDAQHAFFKGGVPVVIVGDACLSGQAVIFGRVFFPDDFDVVRPVFCPEVIVICQQFFQRVVPLQLQVSVELFQRLMYAAPHEGFDGLGLLDFDPVDILIFVFERALLVGAKPGIGKCGHVYLIAFRGLKRNNPPNRSLLQTVQPEYR